MNRKQIIYMAILIATLAVAIAIVLVNNKSSDSNTTSGNKPASNSTSSNTAQQPATNQPPKTYPTSVYFSKHPESDDDPGKTFALARQSPDLGVAKFSITELLKGPTAAESNSGYFTTARLRTGTSNCQGQDFKLTISGGTATLQFCKPFDHLGVVADGQADSELKATLKQYSTVQKVIILNSQGDCEFNLSGMNLCKQ